MKRFFVTNRIPLRAGIRAFSTQTTTETVPNAADIDVLFPISYAERSRNNTAKVPMPHARGIAWGQSLVKNHDLPTPSGTWTPESKRSGVMFTKAGVMPIFDQYGCRHVLTVLDVDDCQVIRHETRTNDTVMQIGVGNKKVKSVNKPTLGHFHKARIHPKLFIKNTKVTPDALLPVGWKFDCRHFVVGQYVDVWGTGRGFGFQGVMKRHGHGGQPASHGVSLAHRSVGSTGMCQDPGRVFKGKEMPGRMGGRKTHHENLRVFQIVPKRNCILVVGHVPGKRGASVYVKDAKKKPFSPESPPPFPTFVRTAADDLSKITLPIELIHPDGDPYANGGVA